MAAHQRGKTDDDLRYRVENSFTVTGHGTAAVPHIVSGAMSVGGSLPDSAGRWFVRTGGGMSGPGDLYEMLVGDVGRGASG